MDGGGERGKMKRKMKTGEREGMGREKKRERRKG